MVSTNDYLKEMEQQVAIISAKVKRGRIRADPQLVKGQLAKLNTKLNALREDHDDWELRRSEFEKQLTHMSRLVADNSALGRHEKSHKR
jgi:predicted  nucleic acid-binding Zn-ribbon protein